MVWNQAAAQQIPESAYQEMRWRMIGPTRGGRTRAACGVASQPNVFYMGAVNGGVWKSNDYGRTWNPDRKSTRLNSSHLVISYAVFCLKKKKKIHIMTLYR